MNHPERPHGGRWLQKLITMLFVTTVIVSILVAIFEMVTFPLWFRGELQPLINATVQLEPLGEGVDVLFPAEGTAPFVESAFIDQLHARVSIYSVSHWWSWLFTLLAPIYLGLALWILWLLDRVVAGIVSGRPFTEENAVRLRTIGLLVVAESLASPALEFLASAWMGRQVEIVGATVHAEFVFPSVPAFLLGWLVVIIGEAFRHGAAMREEQELTV